MARHSSHIELHEERGEPVAIERNEEEFERAAWRVMVAEKIEPERFWCSWTSAGRAPPESAVLRIRTPEGDCGFRYLAGAVQENTTWLVASSTLEGMGPSSLAVEGATTALVFETYVRGSRCSLRVCIKDRDIMIMDNLLRPPAKGGFRESNEGRGCELV